MKTNLFSSIRKQVAKLTTPLALWRGVGGEASLDIIFYPVHDVHSRHSFQMPLVMGDYGQAIVAGRCSYQNVKICHSHTGFRQFMANSSNEVISRLAGCRSFLCSIIW